VDDHGLFTGHYDGRLCNLMRLLNDVHPLLPIFLITALGPTILPPG
jgi:hypothetical protein